MTKFRLSIVAKRFTSARSGALAWGPLLAALACSTYGPPPDGGAQVSLGGSGAQSGTGAESGSVAKAGGGATTAGNDSGGTDTAGSAGAPSSGGKAGDSTTERGGGGVTTTAGSGGSAGTMVGSAGDASSDGEPIDDMEDDDAQIDLSDGRNGYWYVGDDLTPGATIDPPSNKFAMAELPKGDRSKYAARVKAVNFTDWGSVIGFNVVEQAGVKPYDASEYCGVQFWAKAATAVTVRFRLPDGDTHQDGGVCTGTGNKACFDHFGAFAPFTTSWKQLQFKFADLAQIGTGYHPADGKFKADKLFAIEWALPGQLPKTYEIWIDDVEFMKCQ